MKKQKSGLTKYIFFDSFQFVTSKYTRVIDLIGVLKTVMHYGYSGVCGNKSFIWGNLSLYFPTRDFSLSYPRYNTIMHHGFQNSNKIYCTKLSRMQILYTQLEIRKTSCLYVNFFALFSLYLFYWLELEKR